MRLIYTDEAGTSHREPCCVVASVIVEGDNQYRHLVAEINRVISERVPVPLQAGFHIHATEIYSGGKRIPRDAWPFDERLDFLKEVACLPFVHDAPIAFGVEHKCGKHEAAISAQYPTLIGKKLTQAANSLAHLSAFESAMERSDSFLRKYLSGKEQGLVIAEDVDSMRAVLLKAGLHLRDESYTLPASSFRPDGFQSAFFIPVQGHEYRIDHIIDVPNFVKKGQAPMLQLADVCAFSFRRCLSKLPHGDELVLAMLGPYEGPRFVGDQVWFEGAGSGLFNTETYWNEEQRRGSPKFIEEQYAQTIANFINRFVPP